MIWMRSLVLARLTADWMWRKRHFLSARRRMRFVRRARLPLKILRTRALRVALADDQRRRSCARYFGTAPFDASGNSVARSGCASAVRRAGHQGRQHHQQRPYPPHPNGNVHHSASRQPTRVGARAPPTRSPPSCWRCSPSPPPRRPRRASSTSSTATGRSTIKPGQNTISFDGDDVPRPKRSGWIVGFRPNLELHEREDPRRRRAAPPPRRLAHQRAADVRGRRGEDERQAAAAVRLAPRARGPLGAQPHGPQPAAQPLPRLPHLHDRLHPRLLAAGEADAAGRDALGRRRGRQRVSRLRRAPRHAARNGRFTYPRDAPNAYGGGPAAQPAVHPARRRAGADRGPPAPRRALHGPDCSRAAGGP